MNWQEWLFNLLIPLIGWLIYLILTQPAYEDGRYVSFMARIRKIPKRVIPCRNKRRADDP